MLIVLKPLYLVNSVNTTPVLSTPYLALLCLPLEYHAFSVFVIFVPRLVQLPCLSPFPDPARPMFSKSL